MGTLSRASLQFTAELIGWDAFCGRRLLGWLRERGLELAQAREPGFAVPSPVSIAALGRRPGR